ncbi:MAG: Gfo/Idh/MocA family oxidoreductase, partial [Parasporobacterium sp.]|nr:Gfo/Idh/MocA family oxidoreductase [Parasporobacterium sp.]
MGKTKVAVVGSGFVANIHLESYTRFVSDAEIVAICSRNKEKAQAAADTYGIPNVFTDMDEMLKAVEAEVVDICVPNFMHHDVCLKAAEYGKHVICEKPLAMSLEEADEMIEACESR